VVIDRGARGALIDRVAVRDLHMVVNTEGGDDNFGAIGFTVSAPDVELRASSCVRCSAPSFDYGSDGGFVEVYDAGDRLHVHGNVARTVNGFVEVGGSAAGVHANDMGFDHNVMIDAGDALIIHRGGTYDLPVARLLFDQNTVVQQSAAAMPMFIGAASGLRARNNLFALVPGVTLGDVPTAGAHNLITTPATARFIQLVRGNVRLTARSPARTRRRQLPYRMDMNGNAVLRIPDVGAFQFAR